MNAHDLVQEIIERKGQGRERLLDRLARFDD